MKTIELRAEDLGHELYRVVIVPSEDRFVVYINRNAVTESDNIDLNLDQVQITNIAAFACADACACAPQEQTAMFAKMRQRGYAIDESSSESSIRSMVANFLVAELNRKRASRFL